MTVPFARLEKDRRGATVIEFAIIAPIMLMLTMGFIELCYQAYLHSVLQGAVNEAGRSTGLETGANNAPAIDQRVQEQIRNLAVNATFVHERRSYRNFSDVGKLEEFRDSDSGPDDNDEYDPGECFVDRNNNGVRDEQGRDNSGGADDIVIYATTIEYPRLFPLGGWLGWPDKQRLTSRTALRNQPFGTQEPKVVCP